MRSIISFLAVLLVMAGQGHVSGQPVSWPQQPSRYSGSAGMKQSRSVDVVAPLLSTRWAGDCLYNAGCPVDTASHATCLHVPAGSGAVAMAQIMKYYQYPARGTGEHGYTDPPYGIQFANFGATNYLWGSMPDSLTAGNDALATLIYQCGVAQNMDYGTTRSSSLANDLDSAMVKYFGYPGTAAWKSKSGYTDDAWIAMVKAELDAAQPVLFAAYDFIAVQHYFICDGYAAGDLFHFNWGLGGVDNGYFPLNSLTPGSLGVLINQSALFNLAPATVPGSYVMDFENVPDFSLTFNDWTVNDADQHDTYGITGYAFPHQTEPMAFLSFNPAQVTPSMAADQAIQPHGGLRFGACFSSNPPSNSDWFISPQVQLGVNGSFSFWVKSYNDVYGLDTYAVAVSTTDNNPASFTVISGTQPLEATTSWVKKTFNLTNFNNQKIYVAIHCVSNDHFLMMIDDLEVKPQASSTLTADFTADKTSLRVGETVNFTDQSSGGPSSWSWKFPGTMQGASAVQNPEGITYTAPGVYPVSLRVSNGMVSDSVTKTAYITVTGYPVTLSLDFESLSDFTINFDPWRAIDVKGGSTYGIQSVYFPGNYLPMAWICFNPAQTTPPLVNMTAHSGLKLGCSFSSTPPLNPNDKWLISPKMSLGLNPQLEFWVRTYNSQFGPERYNVAVSITDQTPSSFYPLTSQPESAPTEWTRVTYNLSAYANQDVHIGIQCVTNDGFILMIDDISVTSSLGVGEVSALERCTVFPNPAKDHLVIHCPASGSPVMEIGMFSSLGERVRSWQEIPVSGRVTLDVQKLPQGVYLLRIRCGKEEVTRKVSIINQ